MFCCLILYSVWILCFVPLSCCFCSLVFSVLVSVYWTCVGLLVYPGFLKYLFLPGLSATFCYSCLFRPYKWVIRVKAFCSLHLCLHLGLLTESKHDIFKVELTFVYCSLHSNFYILHSFSIFILMLYYISFSKHTLTCVTQMFHAVQFIFLCNLCTLCNLHNYTLLSRPESNCQD